MIKRIHIKIIFLFFIFLSLPLKALDIDENILIGRAEKLASVQDRSDILLGRLEKIFIALGENERAGLPTFAFLMKFIDRNRTNLTIILCNDALTGILKIWDKSSGKDRKLMKDFVIEEMKEELRNPKLSLDHVNFLAKIIFQRIYFPGYDKEVSKTLINLFTTTKINFGPMIDLISGFKSSLQGEIPVAWHMATGSGNRTVIQRGKIEKRRVAQLQDSDLIERVTWRYSLEDLQIVYERIKSGDYEELKTGNKHQEVSNELIYSLSHSDTRLFLHAIKLIHLIVEKGLQGLLTPGVLEAVYLADPGNDKDKREAIVSLKETLHEHSVTSFSTSERDSSEDYVEKVAYLHKLLVYGDQVNYYAVKKMTEILPTIPLEAYDEKLLQKTLELLEMAELKNANLYPLKQLVLDLKIRAAKLQLHNLATQFSILNVNALEKYCGPKYRKFLN